jgi:hypothetical protein
MNRKFPVLGKLLAFRLSAFCFLLLIPLQYV